MTSARERPVRVGVFGLLGSGNLGNDGSLEAVLGYLRADHPDALVDALCGGPEAVTARFGIPATRLHWNRAEYRTASRLGSIASKGLGKFVDIFRTAAWVRRHDVVIVPGMGVLEATLPLRPWGFPYSLFLLCASGRLTRTRVALVSVGAAEIRDRPTRALVRWSGRLAAYRSYRDAQSRDAMRAMGVDTARDEVYPDLAFSLPSPPRTHPRTCRARSASASWTSTAATTTAPAPTRSTAAISTERSGSSAHSSRRADRSGCSPATGATKRWSPPSSKRWNPRWSPRPNRRPSTT